MYRTQMAITLAVTLWVSSAVVADNYIDEWSDASSGFVISQGLRKIEITAPGTYKFQATDGAGLGDINEITVQTGVTGNVTIYIERSTDDDSPGAVNILECNLSGNANTTITELRITGDLGENGPTVADNIDIFSVDGEVIDDIIVAGEISAAKIGTLSALLECNTIHDLHVLAAETLSAPDITVHGDFIESDQILIDSGTLNSLRFVEGSTVAGSITIGDEPGSASIWLLESTQMMTSTVYVAGRLGWLNSPLNNWRFATLRRIGAS